LLRFASLASGSKGNCLVAEAGSTRVLVDCGLTLREVERRLAALDLAPASISAIVVTHEHSDHACGVFDFAAAHGVAVYLTHGTLRALGDEGKVIEGVKVRLLHAGETASVGDIEVRPFTVPHDAREPVQYVLSEGAFRLGVLTDIGVPTPHAQAMLSGCDALVLECNHDVDMLWSGAYPKWLKARIAGPFGHLNNADSAQLLAALDGSRLKHVVAAHLSEQNNLPALAQSALARSLGCEASWVGLATQQGFGWRELR
jgi:phosphoribosyl 1,2-cyclic phosphodiesterase